MQLRNIRAVMVGTPDLRVTVVRFEQPTKIWSAMLVREPGRVAVMSLVQEPNA